MLDQSAIRALLPHGHPMVLVDRVLEVDPGVSLRAVKAVSVSDPCYGGVPPGAPLESYAYPVSLLVESAGQAAALLWLLSGKPADTQGGRVLMFAAARDCRFEGQVFPGDVLTHIVRLDHVVGDNAFVASETWAAGRRVAVMGSLVAVVRPQPAVRPPVPH